MNCPLLNDDIIYYLKGHIYINDYDKMKNVSVKYRDLFDLNPILYNKYYDILLTIRGVSIEHIFDIIDLNIRNKYKLKRNKTIKKKLLKYSSLLEICINNKHIFVIEYLIDIIYNTSKKKFDNIISTINHLYNNDELYYGDITKFCSSLTIIIQYFKNDIIYNNQNLELLFQLNIAILLLIIVKKFSFCNEIIENHNKCCIDLFKTQNMKITEYLDIIQQGMYGDEKYFKKYYINYIINILQQLYIDV
jgi:hypothetical protein